MDNSEELDKTIIKLARRNGVQIDDQIVHEIRNEIIGAIAAQKKYREMMEAPAYQWKKPQRLR